MAPFLFKGGCQRPHINIKLFEKHLQIYRKSNRMSLMPTYQKPVEVMELIGPQLQ